MWRWRVERSSYLSWRVSSVPKCIPEVLARARGRVDHFDGQPGVALSLGGLVGPVGLRDLFPHDHIEARAGLVAKHKASIVVITLRVDEESPTEVHRVELIKA